MEFSSFSSAGKQFWLKQTGADSKTYTEYITYQFLIFSLFYAIIFLHIYIRKKVETIMKKHTHTHNCSICSATASSREERQYAAWEIFNRTCIIDAEEYSHFDSWFSSGSSKIPSYPLFDDIDDSCPERLVYGVIIPQYGSDEADIDLFMKSHTNYGFFTLMDNNIYMSVYYDFRIYKDHIVNGGHIPCALLIRSSIDSITPLEFGFGHTASPYYSNLNVFDSIIRRPLLFCLVDTEEKFNPSESETWTNFIDTDRLFTIAKGVY